MTEQGLRERKRRQTSHALARAAFDLTVEHGIEGFTVDDVVGRVGVSRRTFANYFSCKEEAVTSLALEHLHAGIETMPETPEDTPLLEWVRILARHQLSGGMLDLLRELRALADENPSLRPHLENVHAEIRRTAQEVVGRRAGGPASTLTAHLIVGAAYGALTTLIDGSSAFPHLSADDYVEKVFSALRAGL